MSTSDPSECFVGLPTSLLSDHSDERDRRVSRIGGLPVRFSLFASYCWSCTQLQF
jgi:hypothetical protein